MLRRLPSPQLNKGRQSLKIVKDKMRLEDTDQEVEGKEQK